MPFSSEKAMDCMRAQVALMPRIAEQYSAVTPSEDERGA